MSRRINALIRDMPGDEMCSPVGVEMEENESAEILEHMRLSLLKAKVEKLTKQTENIKSSRAVAGQEEVHKVIKDFFEDIISVLTLWKNISDVQDFEASVAAISCEITRFAEWETCNGKLCRFAGEMESQFKFMRTTYQTVYQSIIEREAVKAPYNHSYTELLNDLSSNIDQLQNNIVLLKRLPPTNKMDPYKKLEKTLNSFREEIQSLLNFMYVCKNLGEPSLWSVHGNSVTFFYCGSTEESSQQLPQCPHKANCGQS